MPVHILLMFILSSVQSIYESNFAFTSTGFQYQPADSLRLLSNFTVQTMIGCAARCNSLSTCYTIDYDSTSLLCRLFEGDLTTGSIASSASSTSRVGMISIPSGLYATVLNQSCQQCEDVRYAICSSNTSLCECPEHTYWNGSTCALALLQNEPCQYSWMCRSDLNLDCAYDCSGNYTVCLPTAVYQYNASYSVTLPSAVTVAGACSSPMVTTYTTLYNQAGIELDNNNTLYVGDNENRVVAFQQNNLTGEVLQYFSAWVTFIYFDNSTSYLYITVLLANLAYIWPTGETIPPNGVSYGNCTLDSLYGPTGIAVDSNGTVYISCYLCNWISKWERNATNSTLVAGKNSNDLYSPYNIALDEANGYLYVADRYNNRIQRFPLDGTSVGVTVAGGNGYGSASNQLAYPTDIYLSKKDGSLYIADRYNSRIQKWAINASEGVTVAGSPSGTSGNTPFLLNYIYSIAFDEEEQYMYVSDSWNNRVQRFQLF